MYIRHCKFRKSCDGFICSAERNNLHNFGSGHEEHKCEIILNLDQ